MDLVTKFYIDADGNYLGGYSQGNDAIPANAIEVDAPPAHGWQKYADGAWLPLTAEQEVLVNA